MIIVFVLTVLCLHGYAQNPLNGRFRINGVVDTGDPLKWTIQGIFTDPTFTYSAVDVAPGDMIGDFNGVLWKITAIGTRTGSTLTVNVDYVAGAQDPSIVTPPIFTIGTLFRPTSNGYPLVTNDPDNLNFGLQIAMQNAAILAISRDIAGVGAKKLADILTENNDAGGKTVTNLPVPAQPSDAATKSYVDEKTISGGSDFPSPGTAGQQFYHLVEKKLYVYTGTDWVAVNQLADGKVYVGNSNNVAAEVTVSGDATLDNTGKITLSDQTVTLAKLKVDPVNDKLKVYVTDLNGIPALIPQSDLSGKIPSGGTNPDNLTAVDGQVFYNTNEHRLYVFKQGNWIPISVGGSTPGGGTNPLPANSKEGDVFYNTTLKQLLVFDGNDWVPIGNGSTPVGADNPDEATAQEGDVFYNTTFKKLFVFSDGEWVQIDAGGSTPGGGTNPLPADSKEGDVFYNTSLKKLFVFSDGEWVQIDAGGSTPGGGTNPLPANSKEGDVFYNTTLKKLFVFSDGEWIQIDAGGATPGGGTNPLPANSKEGDVFYNTTLKQLLVFDGSDWVPIDNGSTPVGADNPDEATAQEGDVFYNTTFKKLFVFSDGEWVEIDAGGSTPGGGTNPLPADSKEGDVFYNTSLKKLFVFSDGKWVQLDAGGSTPGGGTNPLPADSKEGDVFYNTSLKKLFVFSDGKWVQLDAGGSTPGGGTNPLPADSKEGDVFYNTTLQQLLVFDGSDWVPIGGSTFPSGSANPATGIDGAVFYNTTDNILYVHDGSSWVQFKDYSGKDNLGNHTASENLKLGTFSVSNDGAAGKGLTFDMPGNAAFGQDVTVNGNFYTPSDRRLKTGIETLSNVLEAINQMRGVKFEYKDQKRYASGPKIGVIAQELQKVYPEMVTTGSNGYLKVDYTQLSAVLIEAVKAQQKQVTLLNERLDSQQKQIDEIMKRLSAN